MTPFVLLGSARAPCRAHILHAMVSRVHGVALAEELDHEIREATRRGVLCVVEVGKNTTDGCDARVWWKSS